MQNIKIFCCVVTISAFFIKPGLGSYPKRTAPEAPRTFRALPPTPQKQPPTSTAASPTQKSGQLANPVYPQASPKPLPQIPLKRVPTPFDEPLKEEERKAVAKDPDNPFAVAFKPPEKKEEADPEMSALRPAAVQAPRTTTSTPRPLPATPIQQQAKALKDAGYSEKEIEEIQKGRFNAPDGSGRPFGVKDALELAEAKKAAEAAEQAAKFKNVAEKQPTVLERVKQGFATFKTNVLGVKPAAPKEAAVTKQKADEAKLQKQGAGIVSQISNLTKTTQKLTVDQAKKIKDSVSSFAANVKAKFATTTGSMRMTMSKQMTSITRSIDQAIAKLPVNSQQRKEMLSTKFALNHIALQTTKAVFDSAKTTAEKLAAAAEYSSALEKMVNSPESKRIGLAEIEARIKTNNEILSRSHDATTETTVSRENKVLQQQLKSIQAVEVSKKEHDALTKELIDGAIRDSAATTDEKEQTKLFDAIEKAKAVLDTPATRMQKTNAAIVSAKNKIASAAGKLGQSIAKLPASARSFGSTLKEKTDAIANAVKISAPAGKIAALRKDFSSALTTFKNKVKGKAPEKVIQAIGVDAEAIVKEAAAVQKSLAEKSEALRAQEAERVNVVAETYEESVRQRQELGDEF